MMGFLTGVLAMAAAAVGWRGPVETPNFVGGYSSTGSTMIFKTSEIDLDTFDHTLHGYTRDPCPCIDDYRAFVHKFSRPISLVGCANFCENLKQINEHNARPDSTYVAAIRPWHDQTHYDHLQELACKGKRNHPHTPPSFEGFHAAKPYYKEKLMKSIDPGINSEQLAWILDRLNGSWYVETSHLQNWWMQNRVTDVRNQGDCGDCWAESATALLESAYYQQTGKLVHLSVQQMAECTTGIEHNEGCQGGWPKDALNYAKANGGICTEADYPTKIGDGSDRDCNTTLAANCTVPIRIDDVVAIPQDDEEMLFVAAGLDVVSVAMDASGQGWSSYDHGVYNGVFNGRRDCSQTALDHAIVVTGYGTLNNTVPFYVVRNSWGDEQWGAMGGYILISRGNNTCGIAHDATFITF